MAKCTVCSEDELLPFTCSYCSQKFCRRHHLPESHACKGMTKEKLRIKRAGVPLEGGRGKPVSKRPVYKRAYELPGVTEVIQRHTRKGATGTGHFDVDIKIITAGILILILLLGALSRFL